MGQLVRRPEGLIGVVILHDLHRARDRPGPLRRAAADRRHRDRARGSRRRRRPTSSGPTSSGRDMLNLTVHGARISLSIGLLATFVTVALGVVVGIVAGFVGGWLDSVLMRVTDFFLVIPTFVLALILTPIIQDVVGSAATEIFGIRMSLDRDHHRHRHHELVVDRADHPVADAVAAGAGVRRPRPGHRVEQRPHHAPAHPAERHQPHRRQRGADLRRRGPHSRRRSRSSASATRSSRRGARRSKRPGPSARRASATGGTSGRPGSASSSSSWRSRSSATPSTTSSTRSAARRR